MKQPRQQGSDHRFDRLEAMLAENHNETIRRIRSLKRRLEFIMATLAELQTAVADVGTSLATSATDRARMGADIDTAIVLIQDLQAGAGTGGISQTDLDPIVAALRDVKAASDANNAQLEAAAAKLEAVAPAKP